VLEKTAPVATIPGSLINASRVHRTIGKDLVKLTQKESELKTKIADLKARYGTQMSDLKAKALILARGLYYYFTEHKEELTKDKKSYDLPLGGSVEWSESPAAKLEYDMDEDDAVELLEKLGLEDCINYRPTVSKTRLKAAIEENPKLIDKLKGFSIEKGEIFRLRFPNTKVQVKCNVSDGELYLYTPRERKPAPAST
jgi:phage host-nuclease inhibitor protein Gam